MGVRPWVLASDVVWANMQKTSVGVAIWQAVLSVTKENLENPNGNMARCGLGQRIHWWII